CSRDLALEVYTAWKNLVTGYVWPHEQRLGVMANLLVGPGETERSLSIISNVGADAVEWVEGGAYVQDKVTNMDAVISSCRVAERLLECKQYDAAGRIAVCLARISGAPTTRIALISISALAHSGRAAEAWKALEGAMGGVPKDVEYYTGEN